MIFLITIPDDYYFTWQLEIQLYNFNHLGIRKEDIHVLIAYDEQRGLRHYFTELIETQQNKAHFYTYQDNRKKRNYAPSIRPHLIQQHIKAHPYIEHETIFYCDTDIIFRELPDFDTMQKGASWYVSDTRNYLDSCYIKNIGGNDLFQEMCATVGIEPTLVENNDAHCGGAQYLIKKAPISLWEKIENDCGLLHDLMQSHNYLRAENEYIKTGKKRSSYRGIQSWCAEMWAILWNAWLFGFDVKIHEELDFCWSMDSIENGKARKYCIIPVTLTKKINNISERGII
ncbi:MAG: hypothetical protein PW786_12840 [Arachidicoccus sp.]|nr:hypothetical protein [Arachidicoccus sp.]